MSVLRRGWRPNGFTRDGIAVRLTGRFKFRRTLFGRVLLQVEEERAPHWSLRRNPAVRRRWRNARIMDLVNPELRGLVDLLNRPQPQAYRQPMDRPTTPITVPATASKAASVPRSTNGEASSPLRA